MNAYSIALFFHIVGALGFFLVLGIEWISLRRLRRAETTGQVREWLRVSAGPGRVGMISMLMLLASGFYMMATAWGGAAWIIVAIGTIIPMAVIAIAISGRRMAAIERAAAAGNGPVSPTLQRLLNHPLLWGALQTRLAMALGIVFLMTVKPDLNRSLLAMGIAVVLGLISALPIPGREPKQEKAAM